MVNIRLKTAKAPSEITFPASTSAIQVCPDPTRRGGKLEDV